MAQKKQVVVIHGGDTFASYEAYLSHLSAYTLNLTERRRGWKDGLQSVLGDEYHVMRPAMPNPGNARYPEWEMWFSKYVPYLENDAVLVGHSLGGTFLAKYLSEHRLPTRIKATILIAATHDDDGTMSPAGFILPDFLELFAEQGGKIFLIHSTDDLAVPFAELERYRRRLSTAQAIVLEGRGHVTQEEFPELVEIIKGAA